MAITGVTIDADSCTACGLCEEACPAAFEVGDVAVLKAGVDLEANADAVREAAESCPVEAISIQEN